MLVQTMTRQYDATFAEVASNGALYMGILDERPLSKLAGEMEAAGTFERLDEAQGDKVFEEYTELISIARTGDKLVLVELRKGVEI